MRELRLGPKYARLKLFMDLNALFWFSYREIMLIMTRLEMRSLRSGLKYAPRKLFKAAERIIFGRKERKPSNNLPLMKALWKLLIFIRYPPHQSQHVSLFFNH